MLLALLYSVPEEGRALNEFIAGMPLGLPRCVARHGAAKGKEIITVETGMGKVNAAHGLSVILARYRPDVVMNIGIGGAYPESGLEVGDIALAEREIYGDEGILGSDGFYDLSPTGIPLLTKEGCSYFNEYPLDNHLAARAKEILNKNPNVPFLWKSGPFITLSSCTATLARAHQLVYKYQCLCENMEGAAIAHLCILYGISCMEVRGISNHVGERKKEEWNIPLAIKHCQEVVLLLLEGL